MDYLINYHTTNEDKVNIYKNNSIVLKQVKMVKI